MNALSSKFLLILICLFSSLSFSQTTQNEETQSINSGTIDNQFEYLLRKSGNFKGTNGQPYEAVKLSMINALRANTKDSLNTIKKNLADTKAVVNTQAKEISTLKSNLNNTQSSLDATNAEKDSMSLFGIQMSKTGYNSLMWIIIAALLALLLLFIYKFKNSNAVTKSAKKALAETEEEFEQHRKVALEREQKVRRQLQDEINKQKNA
ncbi:tRNA (guanine-N1)-methyltransferase [Neotamlana laminarinivorans]|uniref:tRNA (Guanine-N1)-methyltransferase n=1 Tax=Neotamlana laminarinivorans TaxID=2883124 RepID=A0A9X1HX48_9FLAO|nr:tRNA (guanine-N1)-methyltransferase [Tamlana laminarinivorans]MCB4797764.1 tRNA (guanine-N1)-methyltransferase [Tamlana laminarinivorans]